MSFLEPAVGTVALNLKPRRGSWGGANQWAAQLCRYLRHCGWRVRHDLSGRVDCIVLAHTGAGAGTEFCYQDVEAWRRRNPEVPVIQRINDNDIRKGTGGMDALLALANRVATHTVFVSSWLRDYHAAKWFDVQRPHSVILPGADPRIFHPLGSRSPGPGDEIRVVTHHWSPNPAKGFDIYAEIDASISGGALPGFEFWVIGRWPENLHWKRARAFPPASGHKLAGLLRRCHLYVTASRHEPGAMHPAEGLQCGLPVVYHPDSGGSVEQCEGFGVCMNEGVREALLEARARLPELRARVLAAPPSGDAMCAEYRRLIQRLATEARGS